MSLLIKEPPLQVLPSLAVRIGLNEAIVVQQLHYFLQGTGNGKTIDGEKWIFNTYEEWRFVFPFWSTRTIERIFEQLETMNLVVSCQPEGRQSRRKYYRLNRGMVSLMEREAIPEPANLAGSEPEAAKLADWEPANLAASLIAKTTAKTTLKLTSEEKPEVKTRKGLRSKSRPSANP